MNSEQISRLIDESPMNRGLVGAEWIGEQRNLSFVKDDCVILFDYVRPGVYEFHWLTSSRGRCAIENAKQAISWMLAGPADTLYGVVPVSRPDVRLMARLIGAKLGGEVKTDEGICQIFIMTREIRGGIN